MGCLIAENIIRRIFGQMNYSGHFHVRVWRIEVINDYEYFDDKFSGNLYYPLLYTDLTWCDRKKGVVSAINFLRLETDR